MGKFTYGKNEIRTTVYGTDHAETLLVGNQTRDPKMGVVRSSFTQKLPKETNWKVNSTLFSTTEEEVSEQKGEELTKIH